VVCCPLSIVAGAGTAWKLERASGIHRAPLGSTGLYWALMDARGPAVSTEVPVCVTRGGQPIVQATPKPPATGLLAPDTPNSPTDTPSQSSAYQLPIPERLLSLSTQDPASVMRACCLSVGQGESYASWLLRILHFLRERKTLKATKMPFFFATQQPPHQNASNCDVPLYCSLCPIMTNAKLDPIAQKQGWPLLSDFWTHVGAHNLDCFAW
jgi:hypothetical protein